MFVVPPYLHEMWLTEGFADNDGTLVINKNSQENMIQNK